MSELTNSGFLAGASGAMINEMIQDKLSDMFKDNPAMHQWASALIGGVVAQVVADDAQVGASTASSGTKNNFLTHEQEVERRNKLDEIDRRTDLTDEEKFKKKEEVNNYYIELSRNQTKQGISGEKEGFGYEYGYDPELNGDLNYIHDDINAENLYRQYKMVMQVGKNIDVSNWKENELKSITLGVGVSILDFGSASGSIGYAKDQKGNIYKVYIIGAGLSLDADKLNVNLGDIMKKINNFTASMTSQRTNGKYTANQLRDIYTKDSFSFNVTSGALSIGVSKTLDDIKSNGSPSIGTTTAILDANVAYVKLEYMGNTNEK